ncbi:hypothetical protein VNI00_002624 [Paramarasmius palmivorus]|uniref:Uncharacterized protein n=1 Tax=Paramarasmius palmivorus TaxID=297713 RepID=A0AAW0DVW6_9AGAR
MHFLKAAVLCLLPLVSVASPVARAPTDLHSQIQKPESGTVIAPGQAFDFQYRGVADYSVSSYNYSVWLFTEKPNGFVSGDDIGAGELLGRFDYQNYPGVPYATHPAPAQLVMPDFSRYYSGFGGGQSASNAPVYLAVIEEYKQGSSFGFRLHLTYNELIYNGTTTN